MMDETEIAAALDALPAWRRDGIAIVRAVTLKGFVRPLMLANAVGHLAEAANHHPELTIGWGRLTIRLWTHVANGLTERDISLAHRIEALISEGARGDGGPSPGERETDQAP